MIAAGIFAVTGIEDVDTKIYEPGAPAFAENGINVSVGYPNKSLKPDADLHALRLAELAHERWGHETGGAVVNGVTIPTDRSDRTLIKQALDEIADPPATMPFKVANGVWADMTKTDLATVWSAVAAHVQACYVQEKVHSDALLALTGQPILDYDITTGWPTQT